MKWFTFNFIIPILALCIIGVAMESNGASSVSFMFVGFIFGLFSDEYFAYVKNKLANNKE